MLDVFGLFSVPTLYVLIGIIVLLIVAIILSIVAIAKSSAMKKKYNIMMEGSEGKSIEKIIKEYTDDVKLLKETYENNTKSIKDIYDKMQYTFQKVGIVKYDAFCHSGGYVWIRQPRGNGQYGYLPTGESSGGKRTSSWGKFE